MDCPITGLIVAYEYFPTLKLVWGRDWKSFQMNLVNFHVIWSITLVFRRFLCLYALLGAEVRKSGKKYPTFFQTPQTLKLSWSSNNEIFTGWRTLYEVYFLQILCYWWTLGQSYGAVKMTNLKGKCIKILLVLCNLIAKTNEIRLFLICCPETAQCLPKSGVFGENNLF